MRRGIFGYWFDNEYRQRDDIDAATESLQQTGSEVVRLQKQLLALAPQVEELSATVAVLMKLLADAGQLDTDVLQYRVEAMLEERRAQAAEVGPLRCVRCQQPIDLARAMMTPNGLVHGPVCPPNSV